MSDLEPIYVMVGTDAPKIGRAVRRLIARVGDDAVERLDASESSGDDAVAACNALGLFVGSGRVVLVEGVEKWKAADVKAVAAYAKNPAPSTVLALVGGELKKDSTIQKALAGLGQILVWNVKKQEVAGWVAGQFELLGARADREACRHARGDRSATTSTSSRARCTSSRPEAGGDPIHGRATSARLAAGPGPTCRRSR